MQSNGGKGVKMRHCNTRLNVELLQRLGTLRDLEDNSDLEDISDSSPVDF